MNDRCEKCGSNNLRYMPEIKESIYHPAEVESWECLACGHVQPVERDHDYYEDDNV